MLDEYCFLGEDKCEKNRGGINNAIFVCQSIMDGGEFLKSVSMYNVMAWSFSICFFWVFFFFSVLS